MARTLVYQFPVTIPAGTTKAAPLVTLTQFEPNEVERIEWLFPAGCNGLVGIQIGARDVPIIPRGGATWFTRSGDSHGVNVQEMHSTGDWSVIGYNTGLHPHTIEVYFYARRMERAPSVQLIPFDDDLSFWPTFEVERDD